MKNNIIMIVDDNQDVLYTIKEGFKSKNKNIKIIDANNGKDAIKKIIKTKPDLILLDIMMPVMDGWETAFVLKEDDRFNEIPIVFLTALRDLKNKNLGKFSGVDYIEKPFDIDDLYSRIEKKLRSKNPVTEKIHLNADLNKEIEIGIKSIDEGHSNILFGMNKIIEQNKNSKKLDSKGLIDSIMRNIQHVFNEEENLMKKNNYADFEYHKKQHSAFLERISSFFVNIGSYNQESITIVLNSFRQWFINHLLVDDKKYANIIKST